ncbi:MAG: hypothetical protein ABJP79_18805 [Tateyamaria sp.]|uniref:hypothetical protein n=1 Tax=Tateyamaria sp. TaxID=1929288 RepID=UPI00329CD4D5
MEIALNILLAGLTTLLAIVSIGGETWRKSSERWLDHLTGRGWASVAIVVTLFGVSVWSHVLQDRAATELQSKVASLVYQTDSVLTGDEISLVHIGVDIDFLIERLGRPGFTFDFEEPSCDGSQNYYRWTDIGRNSVQALTDAEGKVVGFSIYNNRIHVDYASVSIEPTSTTGGFWGENPPITHTI